MSFQKVGTSDQRMYGPRKILICGFPASEHSVISDMLVRQNLGDMPLVFVADDQAGKTLHELIELPDRSGFGQDSGLARAIILSGLTEIELRTVMKVYRPLGLASPLWATLTEISVNWPLTELLRELAAEREAFLKQQNQ